jgi:hypothetical protein
MGAPANPEPSATAADMASSASTVMSTSWGATEEEAAARPVSLDTIEDILLSATEALDATLGPKFELSGMAAECVRMDACASLLFVFF